MTTDGTLFLLEQQTEQQFSDSIVEEARLRGWLVHRDPTWRPTCADPGYPDLTLVRGGRVIFAELKRETGGRVSAHQRRWLDALQALELAALPSGCVLVAVWKPSDRDAISEALA